MRYTVFVAILLVAPAFASAQFGGDFVESLTLGYAPQYPRPLSTVTITPQSTLLDLANSTMTLSVNGRQMYSGATRPIEITVGGPGQTTTVSVRVTSLGRSYTKTLAINPVDVSIVVEPLASTHPLYSGQPQVPPGGSVRLVAIADLRSGATTRLDPDTLSYTWVVDGTTLIKESGIGRRSVVLPAPLPYRSQAISVKVVSPGGTVTGGDNFTLSTGAPTLRLYAQDPLQGILFDRTIDSAYTLKGSEMTFVAIPFSLPLTTANLVRWSLNNNIVQDGPTITVRPEGVGQGSATLTAVAAAGIETLTSSFTLTFGERSGGFFGL